ncbi:MAG: glycosyltransferase family 4 protein [Anaerolineales bacterium]|nr:glycosyltransferase family 4 protein [Anaerolineales bacterium]
MRLLFVADGRSPIAINWMRYFVEREDEVHLASTFACKPELDLAGLDITPVAFSGTKRPSPSPVSRPASSRTLGLRTAIRHYLGPLTITRSARKLRTVIERVKPDLVHAMRIPYEGMLAADAYNGSPLLVSVWGNDFTLHAPSTWLMGHYTRWTMQVANALHADCQRDIRLAQEWGFSTKRPTLVIPGNGGIRTDIFFLPKKLVEEPVVINPRGFRAYVRNDVFFKAIPLVLKEIPQARFLCASMAGEPQALQWIGELGIDQAVELLAPMPHAQMAEFYRRAAALVSPSIHDGTPNTLLEGMACGCFPVAGDLESIREWITDGENGLLTDATDPHRLAESIVRALKSKDLREQAAGLNAKRITEGAEYNACMAQALSFYQRIIRNS